MANELPRNSFGHVVFNGEGNGSSSLKSMKCYIVTGSGKSETKEERHNLIARDVGILDGYSADPYGHNCKCPPGNYYLGDPQPCALRKSDGSVSIQHDDDAGYGCYFTPLIDSSPFGGMAQHGRGGIGIHGGGTAAPDPFAEWQGYYDTLGCIRISNFNNERLFVPFVRTVRASSDNPDRAVLFSVFWGPRA